MDGVFVCLVVSVASSTAKPTLCSRVLILLPEANERFRDCYRFFIKVSGFLCAYKITASAAAVICSEFHFVSVAWIRTGCCAYHGGHEDNDSDDHVHTLRLGVWGIT